MHRLHSSLHLAARGGQAGALRALLEDLEEEERVAFLNDADKNGITPVFLAKQKGGAQLPHIPPYGKQAGAFAS